MKSNIIIIYVSGQISQDLELIVINRFMLIPNSSTTCEV